MNFNEHSNLRGKHAAFSPSTYQWLQDDPDQAIRRYCSGFASSVGTILHGLAEDYIKFGMKMTRFDKKQVTLSLLKAGIPTLVIDRLPIDDIFENLMNYINDAVGFRMKPEVVLYYSDIFFGTTDAICFDEKEKMLRVHDLKTGVSPAKIDQLMIYEALFCLEYGPILHFRPEEIHSELRIYQGGDIDFCIPERDDVIMVMEHIKMLDDMMRHCERR